MKVVEYFNLEMVVDDKFNWIAYDEGGEINLFKNKPIAVEDGGYWIDDNDFNIHSLGNRITFIDAKDWKLSLREI